MFFPFGFRFDIKYYLIYYNRWQIKSVFQIKNEYNIYYKLSTVW